MLCSGCLMGPDYVRPKLELPAGADNASQIAPFTAADWWKLFGDPTLDRIELEALA
jgi:multidrug efflux system outer membrane protein